MTTSVEPLFVDANILIYATRPASSWQTAARDALDQARRWRRVGDQPANPA